MFDIAIQLMIDFAELIPIMVCLIFVFNIIRGLLWGGE